MHFRAIIVAMSAISFRLRVALFVVCLIMGVSGTVAVLTPSRHVAALQPEQRSLFIGSSTAGATTNHVFGFTYATAGTVGSIVFEYCTSPLLALPCVAPTGVDATGAILTDQTGETGFGITDTTNNMIVLTRPPSNATTIASVYSFSDIVNPTIPNEFFVRISTYASADGTGSFTDYGAVVNSIAQGVALSGEVPPILNFCVGLTVTVDCTSAEGNLVELGTLTPDGAGRGSSQMAAGTNADFGVAITVQGTTLTSGNNEITANSTPTPNAPGNGQFGLNLRANSDPFIGEDPIGPGIANPAVSYNIPNRFMFKSGDIVATSPDVTDIRKFTVSYLANVPPTQFPGIYTATITYICTALF